MSSSDKRESEIFLTGYGEKFKLTLLQVVNELEKDYSKRIGEVELERIQLNLEHLHKQISSSTDGQQILIWRSALIFCKKKSIFILSGDLNEEVRSIFIFSSIL